MGETSGFQNMAVEPQNYHVPSWVFTRNVNSWLPLSPSDLETEDQALKPYICIYACMLIYVGVHMHVCAHACGGQGNNLWCSSGAIYHFWGTVSPWPGGHQVGQARDPPVSSFWDDTCVPQIGISLVRGFLLIKLWSLCLQGTHLANWAIFPLLKPFRPRFPGGFYAA